MRPVRQKPVWISSTTSIAPVSSQTSRAARRYSGLAGRIPPSPCTGSISTAAVSSPTASRSLSGLLKGVKEKPGTRGRKSSRYSFLWVADSAPRVRPWKPRMAETIPVRPVVRRANLIAASTASAPELQRKPRERPGGATAANFFRSRARTSL